jgi:Xaa-Pro aminopeptidase
MEKNQMNIHAQRLEQLRQSLIAQNLSGVYLPMDDEHLNEYVVDSGKRIEWLFGFTGSAGEALITRDKCYLFVDSRYHTQAPIELAGLPVEIVKLGAPGQLPFFQRLDAIAKSAQEAGAPFVLGLDPFTTTIQKYRSISNVLTKYQGSLQPLKQNPVSAIWADAPNLPNHPYEIVPEPIAGASVAAKLQAVRQALPANAALIVTKVDQVAWLVNLRGADVPYNPVFVSYALVTPTSAEVFCELSKLPANHKAEGVTFRAYGEYASAIQALPKDISIAIDPDQTTQGTAELLQGRRLLEGRVPTYELKARKNEAELSAMRDANLRASRAKIRALAWLSDVLVKKEAVSELRFAKQIESFYSEEENYRGQSFRTISAAGKNSAVVHYGKNSPEVMLTTGELFLIDSGAQYLGGTTDDTRTVAIGEASAEQKRVYTAVLRGHIALATAVFPEDATGGQLDAIARSGVWRSQLSYGHGTGHGVGAYLNVHEGPNRIAPTVNEKFSPGMVTSTEPGAYIEGWGGVRIENLAVVIEKKIEGGSRWFGFEDLTYVPYDRNLIDPNQLTESELAAVNEYHATVWKKLGPTLSGAEKQWLESACKPISASK